MGINNDMHFGNFSSSEIVRLCGTKKVRETYIAEKNLERKLGRVLKKDFTSKETSWGQLMEIRAGRLLETKYSLIGHKTLRHPTIPCWVGSPDCVIESEKVVDDIKGLQLKAFCEMVDAWEKGGIEAVRKETDSGEKFYWQITSNGCLTGCPTGELILYCPYKEELDDIRRLASAYDGPDPGRFKWIVFADDEEMPYLLRGGHYKNLYKMRFEIPFFDKQFLHSQVVEAQKDLIPFKEFKKETV